MAKTRREFLAEAAVGLAGVAAGALPVAAQDPAQQQTSTQLPAGAPPAFGTGQGRARKYPKPLSSQRKNSRRWN